MTKMKINKILSIQTLLSMRKRLKNKTIVLGTGCFDILHIGHLYFLQQASEQGDILIVGINSDKSIKIMKGKNRPIIKQDERAQLIAAFDCVDYVFVYDGTTARDYILSLKPHVFAIGEGSVRDYPDECEATKKVGARLHIIKRMPFPSTTSIVTKIQNMQKIEKQ
ncbi:D-glycero-beta-D-manno-heptose 1-phosphate adenylyltransferase [bacterium (Candidatus Gribaldobacteria) CG23_combo_of_CG06-09_8_20_14_all_37_87_8]|uniref:D-glycero-beta-D-manno-heptose 1-phosphate adenylyltransferase n=1 Tax=bacterium (Candidatus Gribaldobacteria) CG23_combo_of_CG06-09_8_20_14_all_37_87_8 TaxID=2014278 RepID=A0A2G9ZFI5_9BACT|nr:MAG: D-glycero-beta-D-manno-heptose 1-phosphate adenylyltransferase [bacterium (Candidatus Gribaldobacteria) CG23_combo_of_CG06-09_8_20_14_all_37_87_8]